jgi:hypothetical protein
MPIPGQISRVFRHLVDDAAIFPPGLAPLPAAVTAHGAHLASGHADLVGSFIVDVSRLDALIELAPADMVVSVVVSSAQQIGSVVARTAAGGLHLAGLEVRLLAVSPLASQVGPIAADAPADVRIYVEAPLPEHPEWQAVLKSVAKHGLNLKFRTGGTEPTAFPSEREVAAWITDAVAAGVSFKCTAGLHNAVRHTGHETDFEHHGYLNVLLATAQAVAGRDTETVEATLAERDGQHLAAALKGLSKPETIAARAAFRSYGSCSVLEPLDDLRSLHLLTLAC